MGRRGVLDSYPQGELNKNTFVPYTRDKGVNIPLRYHSHSAFWAALVCAISGATDTAYYGETRFGVLLRGDIHGCALAAFHQPAVL